MKAQEEDLVQRMRSHVINITRRNDTGLSQVLMKVESEQTGSGFTRLKPDLRQCMKYNTKLGQTELTVVLSFRLLLLFALLFSSTEIFMLQENKSLDEHVKL